MVSLSPLKEDPIAAEGIVDDDEAFMIEIMIRMVERYDGPTLDKALNRLHYYRVEPEDGTNNILDSWESEENEHPTPQGQ